MPPADDDSTVPLPPNFGELRRDDPPRFQTGTLLGKRYRVVTFLGGGAMGEVYRADDTRLNQPVALKFMRNRLGANDAQLERLYGEVRMGRAIAHENVCKIYDIAEVEGATCIAMEYLAGRDLGSLLDQIIRVPPDTALKFVRQVCAGLAAIHEKGVVHRDLKPRNVLLDEHGRVRITDFGLAALTSDPRERSIAGTPEYMAPEQFAGEASEKSDIYAVGLILYELLTGERVRQRRTYDEVAATRARVQQRPPSMIIPGLDQKLDQVILHCLEDDARARPASAVALLAALSPADGVVEGEQSRVSVAPGAATAVWQSRSLFDETVADVQDAALRRVPVLITGGRGIGKTFILSRLKLGNNTLVISLRDAFANRSLVARLTNHVGPLRIDDFDVQFGPELQELLEHLVKRHPYPMVITSTITPDVSMLTAHGIFPRLMWDHESLAFWSSITAQMQPFRLDPWGPGWKRRITSHLATILDHADEIEISGWATVLIDLTGGHPAMIDAALRELRKDPELRRPQQLLSYERHTGNDWARRYTRLEEQLFGTGLRRLRDSVTWLDTIDPGSAQALRQLARGEMKPSKLPAVIRRTLLDSGLAYRSSLQEIGVSGEVLRRFLAQDSESRGPGIEVMQTDYGGEMRARVARSVFTVPLRGAAWEIVSAMTTSDRPLSIDELSSRTRLEAGSIRSAVQRIRLSFADMGIEGVLENVWGEGYRISEFPIMSMRTLND